MNQKTGRIMLMLLVLISGATAVIAFEYHSAEFNTADVTNGLAFLLSVYVPLVAVMAGYYLGEESLGRGETPLDVFLFVFLVTAVWVLAPPGILLLTERPMGHLDNLASFKVWGDSLVALAVSFYFNKAPKQ